MKVTSFVLGLVTGIISLLWGFPAACAGTFAYELGETFQEKEAMTTGSEIAGAGAISLLMGILGIIGASLSLKGYKAGWILLFVSAGIDFLIGITTGTDILIWGILFGIAGTFAFFGAKKKQR